MESAARIRYCTVAQLALCAVLSGCSLPRGPYNVDKGPSNTFTTHDAPAIPKPARAPEQPRSLTGS